MSLTSAAAGVVLVHGFTGSPDDFGALPDRVRAGFASPPVVAIRLPGHDGSGAPTFETDAFLSAIAEAAERFRAEGRDLVLVGHSTGGTLALAAVARHGLEPRLLVLASAPNRVDGESLSRWNRQSADAETVSLTSVARMVSLVNETGLRPVDRPYPVLLLHGEADALVPAGEVDAWRNRFAGPVRTVLVPGAGHDLFRGAGGAFALDAVTRAIADAAHPATPEETDAVARLAIAEPEVARFLAQSPFSARHLAGSPSCALLTGRTPDLTPEFHTEPVFANIEITTRCNLRCPFCARTPSSRPDAEMPPERFGRILDLLPHAYRITLVGLGEPLLHPDVASMVATASGRGRRVALATNAMALTPEISRRLIDAGLDAVAFSLDAVSPETAARVRPGTAVDTVLDHIRAFGEIARGTRPVGTAVFSAVSIETAPFLESLVETVATLGVDVLMLSDLNFPGNLSHTLWNNGCEALKKSVHGAVRRAFELKLPVLSVSGLEEFAQPERYREHLLLPPARLYNRSARQRYCFSPWQTIPVAVDGTVTICDCRPDESAGNLLDSPFADIWNGAAMTGHRLRMVSLPPPEPCAICPRF